MTSRGMFPVIPMPEGKNWTVTGPEDCGDGNYVTTLEGFTREDNDAYLRALEAAGFRKFADNGAGLAGAVFTATYVKDKWAVTVVHAARMQKTGISVCFDKPLSERLIYKEEYAKDNKPGAKTKLHMLEMWWFGNSFVVQLKNGHFLISDGGLPSDAAYLLDYLESLVPPGEKPVVEGWFISHGHADHCGVFHKLYGEAAGRLRVEGVYYCEVGEALYVKDQNTRIDVACIKWACTHLQSADGTPTKLYRPHTGERLYFSDVTVDVIHTHEQLLREEATVDINDTSTWFMLTAEGQKCLLPGDGERGCMVTVMRTYDREYLQLDMMSLVHHGFNTDDEFTDYCRLKTLLVTTENKTPVSRANQNDHLKASVEEYVSWGTGTKVFTFPYAVGSYETLPNREWIHDPRPADSIQTNRDRYWRSHRKLEARTIRIRDNGMVKEGAFLYDQIHKHLPLPITEDGMMMELRVDARMGEEKPYIITFEDPTGWVIQARDTETLYPAIVQFVETADWTDRGFTAKLAE
ncbi:MAG: hypothetical protein IJU18_06275 [Oscillospiraceae bacterium]|nr:hypothetical protein [Oscillospiraceae bacterium]